MSARRNGFGFRPILLATTIVCGGYLPLSAALIRPSDPSRYAAFGIALALSNGGMLAGASGDDANGTNSGSAYLFRNFDPVTGTFTQRAKLIGSDATSNPGVGLYVAFNGTLGLLGRPSDNNSLGAAYVYRGLDTATGTVTEALKLVGPERVGYSIPSFGQAVALSGTSALVGAPGAVDSGRAYLYRHLDTATGLTTESLRLLPSTRFTHSFFGNVVSLSGTSALVGAYAEGNTQGSVYLYRDLTNAALDAPKAGATPYRTETARLIASDAKPGSGFGSAISFSGPNALVGAYQAESYQGAVYLFTHLDTAAGTVTESVRIVASHPAVFGTSFGRPTLNGDDFLLAALKAGDVSDNFGVVFSGSVSSLTTLDAGHTARIIDQLSFTSRQDWIIGRDTDANQVTLSAGDRANVTTSGTAVYIGRNAGADDNRLVLAGALTATDVFIGSIEGNQGNVLQIEASGAFTAARFYLAPGNALSLAGDYTAIGDLFTYLGSTELQLWSGDAWSTVDAANARNWLNLSYASDYTTVTAASAVPEPATYAAALAAVALCATVIRRRKTRRAHSGNST